MVPANFHDVTHDQMKRNLTLESLLSQFKSGNSFSSRITYFDTSVELLKTRLVLDMFKTFTRLNLKAEFCAEFENPFLSCRTGGFKAPERVNYPTPHFFPNVQNIKYIPIMSLLMHQMT